MNVDQTNIYLLLLSLVALAVGPVLHQLVRRSASSALAALDGFIFVSIGGLVLFDIIPESIALGGWLALVGALVGWLAPSMVERRLHRLARQAHLVALLLALVGLGLHAVVDGLALVAGGGHGHHMLPMAVVLHRLPVGLTIWFLLRPVYGAWPAIAVLTLVAVATSFGFALGDVADQLMETRGAGLFQALVAGSLLHVLVHRSYPIAAEPDGGVAGWKAGLGALGGLVLLGFILADHGLGLFDSGAVRVFYLLALESAPALLLAYVGAGAVYGFWPQSTLAWIGRGGHLSQSLRGLGFGLPLPICSCGVVPVYRSLISRGVPAAAALSFLVATPELSLDAILISLPLLGGPFTAVRVLCAALVALVVGWGAGRFVRPLIAAARDQGGLRQEDLSWKGRVRTGLRTGLGEVVDDTAPWILLGLALAALMEPVLHGEWMSRIPDAVEVLLLALLGIPTYVCASGATPLVAILVFKGVSPGAALAFLLTGPATNITTFGVLSSLHGRRLALGFGAAILFLAMALGYLVNMFLPAPDVLPLGAEDRAHLFSPAGVGLILLIALFAASLLRRGPRAFIGELFFMEMDDHDHDHDHGGERADKCCDRA